METTQEALDRLRNAASQGAPWAYDIVLADLAGMRSTALALRRNLERQAVYGSVRLVCLYGDEYVPDELQHNATLLSRQAPDADLRETLNAQSASTAPEPRIAVPPQAAADGEDKTSIRNARILLVEDNPVNLMVGQRLLAVLGVNCDTATNGEAALMRMSASRYDLVLMDCQMPVLDGYSATRRWRDNEAANREPRRLPIVAMTANAMAGDRQKCLDVGMDDYLPKPVTRAELERCLHRWCKPRAPSATPSAAIDDIAVTIDDAPAPVAMPVATPLRRETPITTAMPQQQGPIDFEVLDELRAVLGDEVRQLVQVFLDDAPGLIAKLESAAARPDYPLLYQAAHSLKSSSANLGATALSAAAKRIELGARAESLDRPAVAVALLAGEFEHARDALLAFSASPARPRASA